MAESKITPLESSKADIPSNEELVDSIVSELKDCLVKEDQPLQNATSETSRSDDAVNKEETTDSTVEGARGKEQSSNVDDLKTENADGLPSHDDDLVDELALKDLEVNYTDEDRERLRKEAEVLKASGNVLFGKQMFHESALEYTKALRTCPLAFEKDRAILYSNRAAAKMKLELSESAIEDCSKAVELDERYVKALNRRAQLYETTDKLDEALADYKRILEIDPRHKDALMAARRLPDQINERNEKLKAEMLGKLKDLGNMVLRPFGLSTENFQLNQDPNSGGYSVNYKS